MPQDESNDGLSSVDKSYTILVCDDDFDTRSIIRESLAAIGHTIDEADGGQAAIDYCNSHNPDLIVLDLMMPGVSGMDFVKWFKGNVTSHFVPVLMLTALTDIDFRIEGLHVGADDYLTKPFNTRELQARVEALLRTRALTERMYQQNEELKRLNEELSGMQEALVEKERELAVVELAGAAAHNLRQPVTSILLKCHLLERYCEKPQGIDSDAQNPAAHIKTIRQECEFMNTVLSKLVTASAGQTENYVGGAKIVDLGVGRSSDVKSSDNE